MVLRLNSKRDYEFSPIIIRDKNFELCARVDSFGRKLIWKDSHFAIEVDSFDNPTLLKLITTGIIGERKVGELLCSLKDYFGKTYMYIHYVDVHRLHVGAGYSFTMMNCLLFILDKNVEGLITNYNDRQNPKPIKKMFMVLGGFVNDYGYLEIKNPKKNNTAY
jgi:hypothetical protein